MTEPPSSGPDVWGTALHSEGIAPGKSALTTELNTARLPKTGVRFESLFSALMGLKQNCLGVCSHSGGTRCCSATIGSEECYTSARGHEDRRLCSRWQDSVKKSYFYSDFRFAAELVSATITTVHLKYTRKDTEIDPGVTLKTSYWEHLPGNEDPIWALFLSWSN